MDMVRRVAHFNDPRLEAQFEEIIRAANSFSGGTSSERPSNPKPFSTYFDTILGKPIWWNGTNWVDANGIVV